MAGGASSRIVAVIGLGAAVVVAGSVVCTSRSSSQRSAPGADQVAPSPSPPPPDQAEAVPDGHAEAVAAARVAKQREADNWRELRLIRLCLSAADVELREFRENYQASLVDGVPAERVAEIYKLSRDNLQACDRALSGIEGPGAIAAARYREMIAGLLPSVLVLRDYHNEADYLEDGFAVARQQHAAVGAGFERLDEASLALRARATELRRQLAESLPEGRPALGPRLYFALLALDDLLTAGAERPAIDAALAEIDAVRVEARRVVADLAGSTTADNLDDVLSGVSAALSVIKQRLRRQARDPAVRLGPTSLRTVEYDLFRGR